MSYIPKNTDRKKHSKRPLFFEAKLPLPCSVNDLHAIRRGGRGLCLSAKGREYYRLMGELMPTLWPWYPWEEERLKLEYTLHETDHRRRDVTNYVKALQDGMEGFIYADDSQIDEVVAKRGEMTEEPYVHVKVSVIKNPVDRVKVKKTPAQERREEAEAKKGEEVERILEDLSPGVKRISEFFRKKGCKSV